MEIAVLLTLVLAASLIAYSVAKLDRWRRTPIELRGNWWGRFERQFRAYAAAQQRTAQQRTEYER